MIKQITFSSITKKVIMSLAGLFLIVFLLVHLGINLFLLPLTENHREIFELAANFMATNPLIKIMEIFLFGGFIIHIIYGIVVQLQNWASRGNIGYKSGNKTKASLSSRYMIYTGILVLLFLAMHIYQFYFIKLGLNSSSFMDEHGHPLFFDIAINLFTTQPAYSILYIVLFVFRFPPQSCFSICISNFGLGTSKIYALHKNTWACICNRGSAGIYYHPFVFFDNEVIIQNSQTRKS
jgi:succinate dehydrogenase / fumarate reductase cytochrome b subunit